MTLPPLGVMDDQVHVACRSCRACCINTLVTMHLEAGDDPAMYDCDSVETVIDGRKATLYALKHKENGDCVYLGPDGCTIHGRAPVLCRTFDCASFVEQWPRKRRRKYGITQSDAVIKAGMARLAERRAAEADK